MKTYKLIGIYFISYFFFGSLVFLYIFGFAVSLEILTNSPMKVELNGVTILISSLIASALIIKLMRKRLLLLPLPYFRLGFYIGNVSLLLMFFFSHLLTTHEVWKFPQGLLIFVVPFMELAFSYLLGWVFWALIPSWLSAYVLCKIIKYKEKSRLKPNRYG